MYHRPEIPLLAAFSGLVVACGPGTGPGVAAPRPRTEYAVISVADLEPFPDALTAVRVLRRRWLLGRSNGDPGNIAVFLDGVRMERGLDGLGAITIADIAEIRRLTEVEATSRFGSRSGGGALLVRTKRESGRRSKG